MTPVIRTTEETLTTEQKLRERLRIENEQWIGINLSLTQRLADAAEEKQSLLEKNDALVMRVRQLNERLEVLEKAVRKWKRLALLSVPALAVTFAAIVLMWVGR